MLFFAGFKIAFILISASHLVTSRSGSADNEKFAFKNADGIMAKRIRMSGMRFCSGNGAGGKPGKCEGGIAAMRSPVCKCVGLGVGERDFAFNPKDDFASCEGGPQARIECSCPVPKCKDGTEVTCGCHEPGQQMCKKSDGTLEGNICCDAENRPLRRQMSTCRTCEDGSYPQFDKVKLQFPKAPPGGNTMFDISPEEQKKILGEDEEGCDAKP